MSDPDPVRRVGGEMFAWSDWDPARGPRVPRGNTLFHLLSELASGSRTVLVAGPHEDEILTRLAARGAAVSCVVRSLADAERIAGAYPDVTVYCGSLGKIDQPDGFDLIVAADGMERLASAEGGQESPDDLLQSLTHLLSSRGVLALMHANICGVQHLVELEPGRHYRSDTAWYPVTEHDELRPASVPQLHDRLRAHGLDVSWDYAVFPTSHLPTVFVAHDIARDVDSPLRGPLGSVLFAALTEAYADTPVVRDPRAIMERAVRTGTAASLAPAWLTLARRADATGMAVPHHDLVVGGTDSFVYEFSVAGSDIRRSVLAPATGEDQSAGLRRVADPGSALHRAGRLFEDHLLQLCGRHDLVGLRAALGRYVAWVQEQSSDGAVAGAAALAGTYDLIFTETDFWPVPSRWAPVEPVPAGVVVARTLWGFAVRLITFNRPHPWHLTASAAELTAILAATAGQSLNQGDLDAAIDLEAGQRAADRDLPPERTAELRAALAGVRADTAGVDIQGYREMADALWRQEYQLQQMHALVAWTEKIIRDRDRALSALDQEVRLYQGTRTEKVFTFLKMAYRKLRFSAGRLKRKLRRNRRDATEMQ
ncbi:MAG TPA: hypothetical protein VF462_12140 [Micromonosporaceae bacterium]